MLVGLYMNRHGNTFLFVRSHPFSRSLSPSCMLPCSVQAGILLDISGVSHDAAQLHKQFHLWKSTDFLEKVTYFRTGRTFCLSFSTTPVKKVNTGNQQNTMERQTLINDKASFDCKQKKANSLLKKRSKMGPSAKPKTGLMYCGAEEAAGRATVSTAF